MSKLTEYRELLVGKTFVRNANETSEYGVTVVNFAHAMNGGFHVHFKRHGSDGVVFGGLQKFLKSYQHELMEMGE